MKFTTLRCRIHVTPTLPPFRKSLLTTDEIRIWYETSNSISAISSTIIIVVVVIIIISISNIINIVSINVIIIVIIFVVIIIIVIILFFLLFLINVSVVVVSAILIIFIITIIVVDVISSVITQILQQLLIKLFNLNSLWKWSFHNNIYALTPLKSTQHFNITRTFNPSTYTHPTANTLTHIVCADIPSRYNV